MLNRSVVLSGLVALSVLSGGCPWGKPEEFLTREQWSAIATQTEQVADHVYQHNETNLEFLKRATLETFPQNFGTAKSWAEVSRDFPQQWNAGKRKWIEELGRPHGSFVQQAAIINI